MPLKNPNNNYLTCPRLKGQPKKHIMVCHKCRYRKKCIPYRNHCQVELPFTFSSERTNSTKKASEKEPEPDKPAPPPKERVAEKLIAEIKAELKEIQKLCR